MKNQPIECQNFGCSSENVTHYREYYRCKDCNYVTCKHLEVDSTGSHWVERETCKRCKAFRCRFKGEDRWGAWFEPA
ncbi:MAG: hypothetical protein HRU09_00950 [Oligoflexales bacterium]|nr:hypothetical protein [Oligoflexales bacterium]